MTLLRQLLLSVSVVIVVILTGTLVFSVNGARDYLSAQLQADSDNAATSLAMLLSQPANQDPVVRELLVTAMFDTGQFQAIVLRDTRDQGLVSRQLDQRAGGSAPDWFSRLLPLRTPYATRQVSDGWTQVGELTVVADDFQARDALWDSSVRVMGWVLLAGLLWLGFVVALMRWLRGALQQEISRQVDSIADGQVVVPGKAHRQIADLMPDHHVIAQARERVQTSRQEAAQRIESLTLELNHDAVTGLPNRRYFMNELRRALLADEQGGRSSPGSGYVLLSRQRDLGAMAASLSRDEVDDWLLVVGKRLQQAVAEFGDLTLHVGRLNGSDFAVLIPDVEGPQAVLVGQAVRRAMLETRRPIDAGRQCRWAFAMTDYSSGEDLSKVFSRLDTALMAAESAGDIDIEILLGTQHGEGTSYGVASEAAWRSLLTGALVESHVELAVHPVTYGNGNRKSGPQRHESTLTIRDPARDSEPLSGFSFMPAAVRLGLSAELDARAIELALGWLVEHPGELVVRVSVPSILKPEFLASLRDVFQTFAPDADAPEGVASSNGAGLSSGNGVRQTSGSPLRRLIIELDAYGLSAYPAEAAELCQIACKAGVRVGLRRVAQQLDAVARLQDLPLAYIKLGGGFLADLERSQGAVSLLNAVIHTATALRIKVLVDDVPGEVAAMLLRDHGAFLLQTSS